MDMAHSATASTVHAVEIRTVTPAWATDVLANDRFSRQRNKSPHHVAFLVETMRRGEFDGGAPLRFGVLNGSPFLVDGQHRLNAVVSFDAAVDFVVVLTQCKNTEELAALYARIDRGRGRNISDALRALGGFEDNTLSTTNLQHVMNCAPLFVVDLRPTMVSGGSYAAKSAEGRSAVMRPWMPAAEKFFAAIARAPKDVGRLLTRREVLCVGLATFADAPEPLTFNFWSGIAGDDGLAKCDPRKKALEFMRRTRPSATGLSALAHGVASCWNAWCRGDTLQRVPARDVAAPLRLLHTRFKGLKT